jgi:O-antigen/teichoic acid export membrane protein
VVHARIAAEDSRAGRLAVTRSLLALTLLFTGTMWGVAVALPESAYAWAFGIDGVRAVLVALGPAVLAGAAASLVAHHLSGIGQHRWNAWTSGAALVAVVGCGAWWYAEHGALGAAAAASVAGLVQISGLLIALHREEGMQLSDWLPRRSDRDHLRANRSSTPTTRSDSNPSA